MPTIALPQDAENCAEAENYSSVSSHEHCEVYENIEFIKKGQFTIPKKIRDAYKIEPGQKGTLIELGGVMLIFPSRSTIPALFDEIRDGLGTSEMSLEEMVLEMRKIRETSDYEAKA